MKNVLLLHGALGHPGYFNFIKEALSDKYVIHTLAFYGHAESELPNNSKLSINTYLEQVEIYCRENDLQQPIIFGYSMGGYVALAYASKFPEKVASVMTLATKLDWSPEIALKEAKLLDPETIKAKVPKFADGLSAIHGSEKWEALTHSVAQLLTELGNHPVLNSATLSAITAPVQLMVGDKDTMVSIAETLQAKHQINNANFAVLPNTVHPFEKINQQLLLQLMKDFFGASI